MKNPKERTHPKAKRVSSWSDTESGDKPETIALKDDAGDLKKITLKGGNLRILKTLMRGPVYCASPVRISDRVMILKRDYGINILTTMHEAGETTPCQRFGIYTLMDEAVVLAASEQSQEEVRT